jgi:hypothetical protein
MNIEDFDFSDDSDEELEAATLDVNLIKSKIPTYKSQKLCEMIVCHRYFGFGEELATSCMEELAQRRINGDAFQFEDYIDLSMKDLPSLDFSNFDIRSILSQAIKK